MEDIQSAHTPTAAGSASAPETHLIEDVLGATVAGLVRARHLADLEAAAIAEEYRDHPLLKNFSVPRVRVPEMRIDLPVLVSTVAQERQVTAPDADRIAEATAGRLQEALNSAPNSLYLSESHLSAVKSAVSDVLKRHRNRPLTDSDCHDLAGQVRTSVADALGSNAHADQVRPALDAVHRSVHDHLMNKTRQGPKMLVASRTAAVKDHSDPSSVSRLQLIMREEGLEWNTTMAEDGTSHTSLVPE